jgi:Flp pilus assembly pilin Flp
LGYSLPCSEDRLEAESEQEEPVPKLLLQLWNDERGQDIAEYAVMLAVILVIVVGTIRLIGSNANNVFSQVGSAIQ